MGELECATVRYHAVENRKEEKTVEEGGKFLRFPKKDVVKEYP